MSQEIDLPSPFATQQTALGAVFANYRGQQRARSFEEGPDTAPPESTILQQSCGLFDRSATAILEMTGEDRQRFLGGLVTCDTKSLAEGESCYGFFTAAKGRILADVTVHALKDRLWLELPPGKAEPLRAHMERYIIVDRVSITEPEWTVLALIGPQAASFLTALGLDVEGLEPMTHRAASLDGHGVHIMRERDLGTLPQWHLWLPTASSAELYARLVATGQEGDSVRPVGYASYENRRIMAGWPLFGVDFDDSNFPQETGIDDAVSYTKGCYLGQEVVARIHYRGGVNKSLRVLQLATDDASAIGSPILADGRAAGTLTSLTPTRLTDTSYSAMGYSATGLAIIHQRVENDVEVEVEGHGKAKVVALPSSST